MITKKLQGGFEIEGGMGSNAVIGIFPFNKLRIKCRNTPGTVCNLIKFFGMGAVCSLNRPIQFRTPGRQDIQFDAEVFTCF
ncbi:MAG: hypothetical protein OEW04_11620, partial [Nitrospirota bacterium]|nr:hypothetical protein [Nitrospirota bacterium]